MENEETKIAVSINLDTTPILFTDNIFMTTNKDGVTLEIGQKVTMSNQIRIVSRIGMSRIHAKKFVTELSKLLAMTEGELHTGEEKQN